MVEVVCLWGVWDGSRHFPLVVPAGGVHGDTAEAPMTGRLLREMGLAKITRLMKFSEVLEMAGIGAARLVSFGRGRAGQSVTRTNTDEISR
ncbi:hypothetical protein E2562_031601 [Oryza meyeriana var. granulata]|uniref:Uncharacterized protein n=1 Tax=Oryza meyeriana var. granulata TaxID=110450 RepID=A0A6G1CIF3_9ORYZ|nr:hypothetical protein E2562_031601 [Oryza meyeriana var. granulata]